MESANGTLKVECVHGEHFKTRDDARRAIIDYIGYYKHATQALVAWVRAAGPIRAGASDQPHRGAAAVEHGSASRGTTRGSVSMATTIRKLARRPSATLQLHIELRGSKPKIWRRVLVPETITLAKLHLVIRAVFGWGGGHLRELGDGSSPLRAEVQRGRRALRNPDPEYDTPGEVRNERTTRMASALGGARTINYVYDHAWWLEQQLELIQKVGLQNYLQSQMS